MYLIYLIFLTVSVVIRLVSDFWKWYPTLSLEGPKFRGSILRVSGTGGQAEMHEMPLPEG